MVEFFQLIDKLISLSTPTLLLIQQLLGLNFTSAVNSNPYMRFYEAKISSGIIESIDYREPISETSGTNPFLVLNLRKSQIKLQDFQQHYGEAVLKDLSAHHPSFIGYGFNLKKYALAVNVDSQTHQILSVSINFKKN